MDIEMIFNELSLQTSALDIYIAREWMSKFIRTIAKATCSGIKRILRTHDNFYSAQLAPNYSLSNWLTDKNVDLEERRFLRTISTKSPFLTDLQDSNYMESLLAREFFYNGEKAEGIGISYLLEALCVSLLSNNQWDNFELNVNLNWLNDDETIEEDEVVVKHASKDEHIINHFDWIRRRKKDSLKNGANLWERKEEFLPSLLFCESVSKRLNKLGSNSPHFNQIKKRLFELENYCANWKEGAFEHTKIPSRVTPESERTLQRYGQDRTFSCPDGIQRTFSWHARITPQEWRLYFFPLESSQKIIIGYIGPHLPIAGEN